MLTYLEDLSPNLTWVRWTIIVHKKFRSPIIIVEVSNYYNPYLATIKLLFKNPPRVQCYRNKPPDS